jgi:hypothetical protein
MINKFGNFGRRKFGEVFRENKFLLGTSMYLITWLFHVYDVLLHDLFVKYH